MTTTLLGTVTFNTTAGTHTVVATPAVGDLITIVRGNTGNTTSHAPTDNNADGLGTYSLVTNALYASSANLMEVWVRNSLIGSATSTTFTDAAGTTTGGGLAVLKTTGATTAGSLAIRQSAAQANQASGGTPTPVFGSAALTTSTIIGAVMNVVTPATMTPKTGYTELVDVGYSSPVAGLEVMIRDTGETGTSIAWGSTSSGAFCSIVVEVIDQKPPTVALNTPADAATGVSTTPDLNFTGTDANSDTVEYELELSASSNFFITRYFKFDENTGSVTKDTIGGGSISWVGTLGSQWGLGKLGSAGVFNGTDNYLIVNSGFLLGNLTNASFAAWILTSQFPTSGAAIYSERAASGNDIWKIEMNSSGALQFTHRDDANTLNQPNTGANLINTGTWVHIAVIKAGTAITFYINGVQKGTGTLTGTDTLTNSGVSCRFGTDIADGAAWLNGSLDEVILCNGAISTTDLAYIYNGGPGRHLAWNSRLAEAGFTAGHPFTSGTAIDYNVPVGDALANATTYNWRVRAIDPTGSNTYGAYSSTRSFTTISSAASINVSDSSAVTENITVEIINLINVNNSSAVTESVTMSWPLAETFQENFDFGGIDSGKWASFGSTITIGTNLDAEFTTSNNYIGINSLGLYNLTGSYMYSQVTDAGNQTLASFEVYPVYLIADTNNKLYIRISGGTVQPIKVVANVATNIGTGVTYNSTTMKYFRIRESGGTTFFDYAADPTSTWTNITSATNPITVTALTLEILVGTWNLENSTAKLDNVNTYPAQYQFSWKGYTWNQRIHQGAPANNQWWVPANVSGPDGNGYLTFALSNPSATPYGGEMFSNTRGWGYGTYVAVIGTQLNTMDHRVGWGNLFTFDFTAAPDYKEIDAAEVRDYASQANIQLLHSHAWNNTGTRNFTTSNQDVNSASVQTHVITWEPGKITFDAYSGTGTGGTNLFHTVQTDNIPTPGLERVHFNIWNNTGVTNYQYVSPFSVIVRDFSFGTLLQINVSDSSAVTESTTATIASSTTNINVFDSSTVTNVVTQVLEIDNINVNNSSAVTDVLTQILEIDVVNTSDTSIVKDNFGYALSFDGTDDATLNTNSSSVVDNFTVIGWIRPTSLPQGPNFIYYNGDDAGGWGIGVGASSGSGSHFLGLYGGAAGFLDPGGSTLTLQANKIYHVALVRRSGHTYLYVNGTEVDTGVTSAPNAPTSSWGSIGFQFQSNDSAARFFVGDIAQVKVYERAFTAANITSDYNSGKGTYAFAANETNLVGLYQFEEGSGDSTADSSSQNNAANFGFQFDIPTWIPTFFPGDNQVVLTTNINVFDGSTVTESLIMLERDNINVFDSSIVTENVSVIEIDNISVSDSSTVTENTTMCLIDNITVNDSSTVLDVIVQDLESDNAVVADATTVTEQVTMLLTDFISVSDSSVVTENISVVEVDNLNVSDASIVTDVLIQILEIDNINVSDSSTVTDVPTLILTIPPIVVSDSSTVTESLTMDLIDLISIFDSSTVTENITLNIPVIMSVFDSSIVTDFVTMLLIDNINTSDSSTVTNVVIQVLEIDTINVNDSSTVTDIITQILETDNINVNDSSTVLDVIVQDLESDNVVVADVTTVTESTTVILTIPPISVFDSSAVTENLTMLEIDFISMNDSSAITDSLIQILEIDFISVNDNSTITDSLVQILEIDTISVFDSSAVTESTTVTITTPTGVTLSISVFDASTVTESTTVTITTPTGTTLSISVFDASTVTESTTMLVTNFVSVFDASAVTEAITMETIYCINVFDGGNLAIGVVAYYSFDENSGSTVSDSSGKGNNGTWQVASSWAPGIINSGGNFTGSNYVSCGNPSNLGLSGNSPFTISAWVNPSASNGGSGSNAIFDYGRTGTTGARLSLIYIVDYSIRSSHWANDHTFTTKLDQNTQNHIVLTYDGTTESLYKNGVFKESWNPTALSLAPGDALLLGNSVDAHITGATVNDEIALWNRGVSADEVDFLYNNRKGVQFNGSAFPVTESSTVTEVLLIYAAEGFPAGLIAYYKYDENTGTLVADSVGGHDGTWNGTLGSQWTTGKINSGGNFNGTNNGVQASIANPLLNGSFSFSAWVYFNAFQAADTDSIIKVDVGTDFFWAQLYVHNYSGLHHARFILDDGAGHQSPTSLNTTLSTGQWYHLVAVRDTTAGQVILYLNGVSEGSGADGSTTVPTYTNLYMGQNGGPTTQFLNGIIDEAALFNRALSATEAANLFNRGMAEQYNGQYLQVTENTTVAISGAGIIFDSSTVIDVVTQILEIDNINIFDSSAVTEGVTLEIIDSVSVFDTSAVTENVTVEVVDTNIIFDSSTVTDVLTQILEIDNINIFDTSTVTDVPTVVIPTYPISVTDTSTVTDVVTQVLEIDTISVFDSSTVTEFVTLLTTDSINVFDSSTVTENSIPEIIDFVSVFDASAVTESLTVVIPTANNTISTFDSSTVTDVSIVELVNLISVIDTTTVTDVLFGQNGGIYLNPLDLSVFEVIGPYQFIFVDGRLAMRLFQNFYIFV